MAGGFSLEVKGGTELRRRADALAREARSGRGLSAATLEGAQAIRDVARAEAPVRSGRTRKAIAAVPNEHGADVTVGGAAMPEVAPVHWGWATRPNKAKRWRGGPIRPNRYMVRAASRAGPTAVRKISDAAATLVRRTMGG